MLTHIIPAASFTAATTAPAALTSLQQALRWVEQYPIVVAVPLTIAVVLLVAWAFAREARRPVPQQGQVTIPSSRPPAVLGASSRGES